MRRRRKRKNPSGFWAWAKEHWFLTFLLASGVINGTILIVRGWPKPEPLPPPRPEPRPEDIPLMPVPPEFR